jgi:hypothetical protein
MITIQAADVKELKAIFTEMFGAPQVVPVFTAVPDKVEKPKAPAKKIDPLPVAPKPEVEVLTEGSIVVEVPDSIGDRACTYEEVLGKVKQLKATTVPDILDKVNAWKTKGGFPALKESTPEQLGFAMNFIESLEG